MGRKRKGGIWTFIKSTVITAAATVLMQQFLLTPTTVKGESMLPTFRHNNKVVIFKMTTVDRFDIIVFKSPISDEYHIKRVIGLGGDTVEMKDDRLFINGEEYDEPYLHEAKKELLPGQKMTEDFKISVPEGSLFVMGDNRQRSRDSRSYGTISEESILGEAVLRFYPFDEIGYLH